MPDTGALCLYSCLLAPATAGMACCAGRLPTAACGSPEDSLILDHSCPRRETDLDGLSWSHAGLDGLLGVCAGLDGLPGGQARLDGLPGETQLCSWDDVPSLSLKDSLWTGPHSTSSPRVSGCDLILCMLRPPFLASVGRHPAGQAGHLWISHLSLVLLQSSQSRRC